MTRDDALSRLRRQLPVLKGTGVTALSVVGPVANAGQGGRDEIEILLAIDIDAHPQFSLLTLGGIKADLEDELGMDVSVLIDRNLRPKLREHFALQGVTVA